MLIHLLYYYCSMSHFLDENCPFLTQIPFKQTISPPKQKAQGKKGDLINQQLQINQYCFQKQVGGCVHVNQNEQGVELRIAHKGTLSQRMVILQKLRYNKTLKWWQNSIQVMDRSNNHLKIYNTDKIIYIYKYFLKKFSKFNPLTIKLSINPTNGIVKIRLNPLLHSYNPKALLAQLHLIIQQTSILLSKNKQILMQIYEYSNNQAKSKAKQLPDKIKKHMSKFGVHLSLGAPQLQAQTGLNINEQLQRVSRVKILDRQVFLLPQEKKQLQLYLQCGQVWDTALGEQDLQYKCLQKDEVRQRLKMPGVTKCKNTYENNYILNSIKIDKYLQMNPLPINQGGFTSIYLAQVQFWYVYSGNKDQVVAPINQESFTADKLLKKLMIIKREQKKARFSLRNRIQHQKNILKQIKCGNALFIPKYYISSDQHLFKDDLLSDFIILPNLIQYVLANKLTLSLSSKIYILFTLVQSLRYLKFYRIVHLDLKPNNIMISRTMMVKIIDFGQSYHPNICPQVYAPGFTMPYSSPQSFYPSESFSQKNDIFSIGVISYQILYGRFPFFLHNEKTHSQIYKYKEYTDHWFYNPEELKNYGDNQVFPILQLIFGRCLDPNPARRPQLDWLCLILRECVDFYL